MNVIPDTSTWSKDKPYKMAVFLTAVYPGAGQVMQKRWLTALIHIVAFTITIVWFFSNTVKVLFANLKVALDWGAGGINENFVTFSFRSILEPFFAALVVYGFSIADVVYENNRRQHKLRRKPPPLPEPS